MQRLTYKKAGVDIKGAGVFVKAIKPWVKKSGFAGLFELGRIKGPNSVLVSSTDGVGTKLMIAQRLKRHSGVGIDLVAMNVNDIICYGARPLFFLDYIACGKLKPDVLIEVIKGIGRGCRQAQCSLVGGETAEMPGFYERDEYDLAGFCVGVVEKDRIIDGSKITGGDKIIGLQSNGLHSNGFSLVRKVFKSREIARYADELLKPTRIYVKPILSLLQTSNCKRVAAIKGIAHITGGAFYDKIIRILPSDLKAVIYKSSWKVPEIFKLIQNKGNIAEEEMYHTFNMGVGMVLVIGAGAIDWIKSQLDRFNIKSWVIGEIVEGRTGVILV
jgi:phosphoribosylformylglycinamidine cyclo-ligase